jgi:hypothetical protein
LGNFGAFFIWIFRCFIGVNLKLEFMDLLIGLANYPNLLVCNLKKCTLVRTLKPLDNPMEACILGCEVENFDLKLE